VLFAGLRTEEAAKLTPEDIREEEGVVVLDINRRIGRLKTKNADRLIPVHSASLKELLEYTSGRPKGTNLWGLKSNSSGVFSSALSKRLNTVLDTACPEDDKLVSYSLRQTLRASRPAATGKRATVLLSGRATSRRSSHNCGKMRPA
jgi:integrase